MNFYTRAGIAALVLTATLAGCGSAEPTGTTPVKLVDVVTPSAPLISTSTVDAAAQQAEAKQAADAKAAEEAKAAADAKAAAEAKAAAAAKADATARANAAAAAKAAKAAAAAKADATARANAAAAAKAKAPKPVYVAPQPSTYYANCTAVRAAGAAPIYAGQPGYSRKLDRDGDGIACE